MDVLSYIEYNAINFSASSDRQIKKMIGQFFTPKEIAKYMASLIELDINKMSILDPGAGNGILSCAVLYKLLENAKVDTVYVDLYENDDKIIELLKSSFYKMEELYNNHGKKLIYTIKNEDFIIKNSEKWRDESFEGEYDIVISNPPYKKIRKSNDESKLMNSIIYGQPNIYFLFMAMSIKLLKKNGQFIFITPRSYFCGTYFNKFRKWLLTNNSIDKISILDSRKNAFDKEEVLQETVIIKGIKNSNQNEYVEIGKINKSNLFVSDYILNVEKNIVFEDTSNYYIKAPTNKNEYNSLKFIKKWNNSLEELGIKVSTGKVVDFRCKDYIFNEKCISNSRVPLIWDINLKDGYFIWPVDCKKKYQIIAREKDTIPNLNYLFIRRISSKEENRRVQIVQYYKEMLNTDRIGVENHVNYIYKIDGQLDTFEMLGLYIIFNSNIVDDYFRVLCGSTQINATEIKSMKFPSHNEIRNIGRIGNKEKDLSSGKCDNILLDYFK
ncbi:Eco57I restriction-modification methylase domain-containing protein [Clostridium beijerinckii]|uniref:Eco57I restriction-modification methylase domain-containing protein n=1 Tax=Clostridium beijerinckii TaxID=1520 RepID=UPI0022E794AE|nr:N-6 DNA methylase [Clostridium beijerinckii]